MKIGQLCKLPAYLLCAFYKHIITLCLFLLSSFGNSLFAKDPLFTFDFNANCLKAYQYELAMHFTEANQLLAEERKNNPANLLPTYLADYEDCLTLMLNCDMADYERRAGKMDIRLKAMESGDKNSPWYLYCQSGIYMHWALVNLQCGEQLKAALKFRKCFALLKDNEKLFPSFEYNQYIASMQEAVVGSLPGSYKWIAAVFGYKGNIKKGMAGMANFVNTHNASQPLFAESQLFYLYARFYLAFEQKEVWNYMNSPGFVTQNNLLNTYVKVSLALDYNKADGAIELINDLKTDAGYNTYPIFKHKMGLALLTRLDTSCIDYFRQYLKDNKSDRYIKDSWQKMAYTHYLHGNMGQANYCRMQPKTQGYARLEVDKQAVKFAEGSQWPERNLLKARLLTEGGYTTKAFEILRNLNHNDITELPQKAEYFYRLGRVYHESGDTKRALEYYQYTIYTGKNLHEQFAARASLQKGIIYEHSGMTELSIAAYKECLKMPAHDFQNSIDQQAKAGLNRVE